MLVILLSALAVAADDVEPPVQKSVAPRLVLVALKGDQLVHRAVVTVSVPVSKAVEVEMNGKKVTRVVTEYVQEQRTVELAWDAKKATITTAGGKKIDFDDLKKRLPKPRMVVVSGDGKAVDDAYLKLLDKDAIVIVPEKPNPDKEKKEDK